MPFDSNGTFNRLRSWVSDAAANILIRSDYHDAHDADIAAGLSNVITKDGRTQPTANLPMNGKKFINVGDPSSPSDVATKNYVDSIKSFTTGLTLTGANYPNGFLSLNATTGINGVSWANADMSWIGKVAETGKWAQRLVVNSKADGSGTDLVSIDKVGRINVNAAFTNNLMNDGTGWFTPAVGTGTLMSILGAALTLQSNDTPTTVANGPATLSTFFTVNQTTIDLNSQDSSANLILHKKNGTGSFGCYLYGQVGTQTRWRMDLGDGAAETGAGGNYSGSNFAVYAADNAGGGLRTAFSVIRATNVFTAGGEIHTGGQNFVADGPNVVVATNQAGTCYFRPNGAANAGGQFYVDSSGNAVTAGAMQSGQNFVSSTSNAILAAQGGACFLRPNGAANAAGQFYVDGGGRAYAALGYQCKDAANGPFGGDYFNFLWTGTTLHVYVNTAYLGNMNYSCDYRIKDNIQPLGSVWEGIKKLRPVSYTPKAWGVFTESDEEHWGLIAHEAQEALFPGAATGSRDDEQPQALNPIPLIAALTKGLQEAMARIEALEARA